MASFADCTDDCDTDTRNRQSVAQPTGMAQPDPGSLDPLLAAAPDGVVTIDERGCVVELNPAAETMFGYPRAEALGRPISELVVPPSLREAHDDGVRRVASGGEARILGRLVQFPAKRSDGSEFPVEMAVAQTQEAPARFTAWIRDLSEARVIETESVHLKTLLERAEQLSQVGSWSWSRDTDEVLWSDNLFRLFALEPGELRPSADVVLERTHPEDRSRLESAVEGARSVGELAVTEYRVVWRDGSVRHLRATAAAEGGEPPTMVGTVEDVTDQRRAESEIAAYLAVSEALTRWDSLQEGAERLLQDLIGALECSVGVLWLPDEDVLVPRVYYSAPAASMADFEDATFELRFSSDVGLPGEAWRRAAPVHLTVLPGDRNASSREAAGRENGLSSAVAIPAVFGERVLAVIELCSRTNIELTSRLMRLLTGLGYELGAFLHRHRAELVTPALTPRQLQILELAAQGLSTPDIATQLVLARSTVKSHFEHIYETLNVSDRAAAVAQAFRQGLIE